ncbi:MAG: shikimate kinase [Saprospiraceae bacterium]
MIISLIGFMGSGKSLYGRLVAEHYAMEQIDLDDFIMKNEEKTINEIFESDGEKSFRKLERRYLNELVETKNNVILSLGGGTPCQEENWSAIRKTTSIYLKRTHHFLFHILKAKKANRPLIKNLNDDKISELINTMLVSRAPFYERADHVFDAYGSKIVLANRLIRKLDVIKSKRL